MQKLEQIVNGGYCIGCGVCSCASSGGVPLVMNEYGMYQADVLKADSISESDLKKSVDVCPFSDAGPNEDVIGEKLFGDSCRHDSRIGYYKNLYVGYVTEDDFRAKGTSGGVITWVLTELLKQGDIDAVVHVKKAKNPEDGVLYQYGISRSAEEILAGAKSRYYPIEMSDVLNQIKQTPGRYAVVGLPCFIKAVRRLADKDSIIKERVVYTIGLVCGHLKSKAFADCFGWQAGIVPGQLEEVDFRVKLPARTAGDYGVYLRGSGKEVTLPVREFLGANWGHNFFRYSACDYCDDVFAETADIVIGDAWLPKYEKDPKGTCVVVVRNNGLRGLIESALKEGRLGFDTSTVDQIAASQAGGLRDRREGLAWRLHIRKKKNQWAPSKRVVSSRTGLSQRRKRIYENRSLMGAMSHSAWAEAISTGSFNIFEQSMSPFITLYQHLYRPSVVSRIAVKINYILKDLID